jgi:cysteine desulfurase
MSIYLDHASTTPLSPLALEALVDASQILGNASSQHNDGRNARKNVEQARELIAECAGVKASEIIFTASGTESDNLAIKGLFWKAQENAELRSRNQETVLPNIIVTTKSEHHAVLDPIEWLVSHNGAEVIYLDLDQYGFISLQQLEEVCATQLDHIALISIMHGNNEIGTINDIHEISRIARKYRSIPVHSDLVQSFGKVEIDISQWDIAAATISAHKLGGPLGVAALYVEHGRDLTPVLHGGGHEREIRSGTLNMPSVVSFAQAVKISCENRVSRSQRISELRDRLRKGLERNIKGVHVNGALAAPDERAQQSLPGILNIRFDGVENDALLLLMDSVGISASAGSACTAGVPRPSHVLLAIGLSEQEADASIRFSLGSTTTEKEIDEVIELMPGLVERARTATRNVKR